MAERVIQIFAYQNVARARDRIMRVSSRSQEATTTQQPTPSTSPGTEPSTAMSTGTTGAISRRSGRSSPPHANERHTSHRNLQDSSGNPPNEVERQESSSRNQTRTEESLLDGRDGIIDIDEEYMEGDSGVPLNKEEQKGGQHLSSRQSYKPSGGRQNSSRARGEQRSLRDKEVVKLYRETNAKLLEAEGTVRERDDQIRALTETITRLHLRDGGMVRDDNYFTGQFSDITNSITQWTLNHFPKSTWQTITDLNDLPVDVADNVRRAVYDSTDILKSTKSRRDVIASMVIEFLVHCVFAPCLFGAPDASGFMRAIGPHIQGTDYQIRRWRSFTTNLLAQGPNYERQYNEEVYSLTQGLGSVVGHLAPMESDATTRNADLHKIVGCAAALSVEISKQLDLIYLLPIRPGSFFNSEMMEDLGCLYELDELDGKAVVQISIFPAIMRRSCQPNGPLEEEHNLMKAKVTTIFVDK